jgi:hypothetical protein
MSNGPGDEYPDPRAELSALIEAGLGHPITDPKKFERLVDMQAKLHAEQERLSNRLLAGEISQEKYISDLDAAMRDAALVGKDLLGPKNFRKIFGEFRVHEIIDVPAFIEGHRQAGR